LVVDNGSTDGSIDAIRERFPGMDVIENGRNLGFAEGNNVGIRAALKGGADYVLLLNNDTILCERDCLDLLVEYIERKGNSIVGPLILYSLSDKIWFAGGKIDWIMGFCRHIGKRSYLSKWKGTKPYEVDYISGCALLLKKSVIETVGLLDPDYFLYYEDVDLCTRASTLGIKCFIVPQSRIWHKLSASAGNRGSDRLSAVQAYHFGRNGILFARKNLRGMKKIIFLLGQLSFRLAYGLSHCQNVTALKDYMKGVWDGIRLLRYSGSEL